jgi:sigma-B regulation protein RsbU (phosphoserine phosphatase)
MSENAPPLSFRYQQALAPLARQAGEFGDSRVGKRLSELLTLLDFNTTLNRSLALSEILDLVLLVAMGETRASWAGVAIRDKDGVLRAAARRGSSPPGWREPVFPSGVDSELEKVVGKDDEGLAPETRELLNALGAYLAVPLRKGKKLIGILALGEPALDLSSSYGGGERAFVEALSISAAASIDNGRIYEELKRLNRSLSLKVYQLNSLFDVTRELYRALDAASVREVLMASAMGQLLATRCALIQPKGAVEARGIKFTAAERELLSARISELSSLTEDVALADLETGPLRDLLEKRGFERVIPLRSGSASQGALVIGRKANRKPLSEEDIDFLRSLGTQGAASLDNLRLTREWVEKQKIEKELAVAREIQRGLLPDRDPSILGWDIAGINIPSLTVGGDYYDYLEGAGGKLGLAIADVSGKGTGPALLMATVQASLRALTGLGDLPIDVMWSRLNQQLYQSSEANKYVTVFYACLDPQNAELEYLNAGHCHPLLFRRHGAVERLIRGGPVIGLLPEVSLEVGRTSFEPGDMLVAYTDGLSETRSPVGEEFEEERIIETARAVETASATEVVAKLVSEVRIFAAGAGLGDDLTLMVVKRL